MSQSSFVYTQSVDPLRADIRICPARENFPAGVTWRGRLMGPRCRFANTIEVAFPIRPLNQAGGPMHDALQTLLPEPSLWEPTCPFLYEGPLEAWHDGKLIRKEWLTHGLKLLTLSGQNLIVNGKPLQLRAQRINRMEQFPTDEQLLHWRGRGINTLIARPDLPQIWGLASKAGFFVLGIIDAANRASASLASLRTRPPVSALGWLIADDAVDHATEILPRPMSADLPETSQPPEFFGQYLQTPPAQELPNWATLVVTPEKRASEMKALQALPVLDITE